MAESSIQSTNGKATHLSELHCGGEAVDINRQQRGAHSIVSSAQDAHGASNGRQHSFEIFLNCEIELVKDLVVLLEYVCNAYLVQAKHGFALQQADRGHRIRHRLE